MRRIDNFGLLVVLVWVVAVVVTLLQTMMMTAAALAQCHFPPQSSLMLVGLLMALAGSAMAGSRLACAGSEGQRDYFLQWLSITECNAEAPF